VLKAIDFLHESNFGVLVFCLCGWERQPLVRCRWLGWKCCHLEDGNDWDLSEVTVTWLPLSEYVCVVDSTSEMERLPRFSC
jgi:hypothetical protein